MTTPHIYHREIRAEVRTSLSVIVGLIGHNATVLDLGTGSGALGNHLTLKQNCTVDGVTHNEAEASIARSNYRRIEVADLELCSLVDLFPGARYDFIVCADVLEHIRNPERLALAVKDLLAPDGKLIISVPNLSYCGLVAELMEGEFEYREEGLLDRTHVRFFTLRSLQRFLRDVGWYPSILESIHRPLNESEFRTQFDALPPSVARHLLSLPQSLAYQFVVVAHPESTEEIGRSTAPSLASEDTKAEANFSCQMYFGNSDGFAEDRKLVTQGVIGQERQLLSFSVPAEWRQFSRIRLDPADRAGYLYLYRVALVVDGKTVWEWFLDQVGVNTLGEVPHQQMVFKPPLAGGSGSLIFLTGSDPWMELPVPLCKLLYDAPQESVLIQVEMGWPMSADYLALGDLLVEERVKAARWEEEVNKLVSAHSSRTKELSDELILRDSVVRQIEGRYQQTQAALLLLREEYSAALAFESKRRFEYDALNSALQAHNHQLSATLQLEGSKTRQLLAEKKALSDEKTDLATRLTWIENSRLFRLTRPLVKAKMRLNPLLRKLQGTPNVLTHTRLAPPAKPSLQIDIVVPVYKGLEDTQRCISSVLASRCATPFRVVIINDASPETSVTNWLREIAESDERILLLENEENLGFVGTVNRGMSVSDSHDVVLLNSDTEVANDWLDRLKKSAYVGDKVGTVTPFSNNATICSYPVFCGENPMLPGHTTASLDMLFAQANSGQVVDIPTGVGFCMYIRRECLSEVGLFDVANFGKGYGEENDFCRRAAKVGWRNLHALDTFVLHAGGVSFGASKNDRITAALQTLARLYPDYDSLVQEYLRVDPARSHRHAVDSLRIQASGKPTILMVLHDRGGGTIRHAFELAEHLSSFANFLTLTPTFGGTVRLRLVGNFESFSLTFSLIDEFAPLIECLRSLGVSLVHFHHLIGHNDLILRVPEILGVPYDFTVHDYFTFCPQISLTDKSNRYCGELGVDQCKRCLDVLPAPGSQTIEAWRSKYWEFLSKARFVIAPSEDVFRRISRYLPTANIRVTPHTDLLYVNQLPTPRPRVLAGSEKLRVLVVGALSPIKGADLLEDVAVLANQANSQLEFHLVGYAYRSLKAVPDCNLVVHGAYAESELQRLFSEIRPDIFWFPALWPETYSYTLSACLLSGTPIVAPNIGAFPERLVGRAWTWIEQWDQTASDWLNLFESIRLNHFSLGIPPPVNASAITKSVMTVEWSYQSDYLHKISLSNHSPMLSRVFFENHIERSNASGLTHKVHLKKGAMAILLKLRASPLLSGIARKFPLRWQTRIKTWLTT